MEEFTAAVSARRTSGTEGAYGIIFGLNQDWSEFYEVIIDQDAYSIWKYDNGSWTSLRNWATSGHINTGTAWNRLKVIREGSAIKFYVNDQYLTTAYDGSYTGLRRIGLVAYSPLDSSVDVRFDDFTLYPTSCGDVAPFAGMEFGEAEFHEGALPPDFNEKE